MMNVRRIIVQEYEKITPKTKDTKDKEIGGDNFKKLQKQVESAKDFLVAGYNYVSASNYVGVFQLSKDFQVEILPKVGQKQTFDKLRALVLQMLRCLPSFSHKVHSFTGLDSAPLSLDDFYIRMYLDGVMSLVKRGLKSAYAAREGNLPYLKGKLLFNAHIRENFAHQERFYVAYDEFCIDRPEHRLIKAALLHLRNATQNMTNENLIRHLLAVFADIEPSRHCAADFSSVIITRQNREYADVMEWTKIFLQDQSFTPFGGATKAQPFLFPMYLLFQEYMAKKMDEGLDGWTVEKQVKDRYLFGKPDSFLLQPDILLTKGDRVVIMDTKWKKLNKTVKVDNYGIAESDMYQMFVYAQKYLAGRPKKEIWLLYPKIIDANDENNFQKGGLLTSYKSYKDDVVDVTVHIFEVDLLEENGEGGIEESIKEIQRILDSEGDSA